MLRLVPMTQSEFDSYLERAVPEYAQAHIRAGDCDPGEALALAQADYASLLPLGLATPNHHLFTIRDGEESVGIMWFQARDKQTRKSAYLFDFSVVAGQRRKGYGRLAMRALEEMVAAMGMTRINLNVMGYNDAARALYEQCGYRIAGIGMTKVLELPPS
jgi:ribosomal protein S18 acetylase RimI-like enzyme